MAFFLSEEKLVELKKPYLDYLNRGLTPVQALMEMEKNKKGSGFMKHYFYNSYEFMFIFDITKEDFNDAGWYHWIRS